MPQEGKAANPFHSLAALQKLAHHDSFRTAPAVAFPHERDLSRRFDREDSIEQFEPAFARRCESGVLSLEVSVDHWEPEGWVSYRDRVNARSIRKMATEHAGSAR